MKRLSLGLLILGITLMGCKQSKQQETTNITAKPKEKTTIKKTNFIEGALVYEMSLNDSLMNEFVKYISQDPLYSLELAKEFKEGLAAKDQEQLIVLLKDNPSLLKEYGTLPFIKNNVYVAGYEVVYKGEGATYVLENKWNDLLEEGFVYTTSTIIPNTALNFAYKKDFFEGEKLQKNITIENYDRKATSEISEVAGYEVEKIVYTRNGKNGNKALPDSVIVYSSLLFNPVLNRVMPYYVNEVGGVLKMEVSMSKTNKNIKAVYEAKRVVERKLLEQETVILATKVFYDIGQKEEVRKLEDRLSKVLVAPTI